MKLSILAASTILMCAAGTPQSADAGGFAISIGGRNGGFSYYSGPAFRPVYGYGPVGYRGYGYRGGRHYGYSPVGYRGYGYHPYGRNRGYFDRGDRRRFERDIRRVIRRW